MYWPGSQRNIMIGISTYTAQHSATRGAASSIPLREKGVRLSLVHRFFHTKID
jgi:hypothetical protein